MISQQEFDAILADTTKRIEQDLTWCDDEDHSPAVEFRAEVKSAAGYPLFLVGRYNQKAGTLSFALLHRGAGRVYALDLGADHHNPTCDHVGEKHKHSWTEAWRDKMAYAPEDITAPWNRPVEVWRQFCAEARIQHSGTLPAPPTEHQEELF